MMHNFDAPSRAAIPGAYGHFSQQQSHTPTYANSTQALFAADDLQPNQTPYQQMYHYDPIKSRREFHFPFRALMIALVIGAMSFGAFAIYRAFTNPSPVNAEPPYGDELAQ